MTPKKRDEEECKIAEQREKNRREAEETAKENIRSAAKKIQDITKNVQLTIANIKEDQGDLSLINEIDSTKDILKRAENLIGKSTQEGQIVSEQILALTEVREAYSNILEKKEEEPRRMINKSMNEKVQIRKDEMIGELRLKSQEMANQIAEILSKINMLTNIKLNAENKTKKAKCIID